MNRLLVCICFLGIISGCNALSDNRSEKTTPANMKADSATDAPIITTQDTVNDWLNNLVADYIQHSNQELIRLNLQDTSIEEVWIDQGMAERNGSSYYMCQIGHHLAEEDGSDPRFVTDGWVYVDSAKRLLYEYDLPNDSLILWKQ